MVLLTFHSTLTRLAPTTTELKALKKCEKVFAQFLSDILHLKADLMIEVMIVGTTKMRALNALHRGKDYVTDVISFPQFENLRGPYGKRELAGPPGEKILLGDIVLCYPQAQRQAKKFHINTKSELIHLLCHGFLHLLGYDHEISMKEEELMQKHEDYLITLAKGLS